MNWNEITYNIEQFWNKPVPIIGFTIGTLIIGIIVIISKTSFGRKWILRFKDWYQELNVKYNEAIEAKDKIIAEKDEIIANLTKEYETKIALLNENRNKEREMIIAIAENINNVKIKKLVEEFKQEPIIEVESDYILEIKNEYESKYEEVLKQLEEIKNGKISEQVKEEI